MSVGEEARAAGAAVGVGHQLGGSGEQEGAAADGGVEDRAVGDELRRTGRRLQGDVEQSPGDQRWGEVGAAGPAGRPVEQRLVGLAQQPGTELDLTGGRRGRRQRRLRAQPLDGASRRGRPGLGARRDCASPATAAAGVTPSRRAQSARSRR